mgnify:CR=1 FL=1
MSAQKRITLLCGHYGSGKTNIAVNMAFDLKNNNEQVTIADLDIVNPYFRTNDARKILEENDIKVEAGKRYGCLEYATVLSLELSSEELDMCKRIIELFLFFVNKRLIFVIPTIKIVQDKFLRRFV